MMRIRPKQARSITIPCRGKSKRRNGHVDELSLNEGLVGANVTFAVLEIWDYEALA